MKISSISCLNTNFGKPSAHPLDAIKQKVLFSPKFNVSGNKKDGYSIYVSYENIKDACQRYIFNPDGSAMSMSPAWGNKKSLPAGTLSEIYEQLPDNYRDIDNKLAMKLIDKYKEEISKRQIIY